MKVFGFVGPSGTGKSYRALWVARERGINYIIDDGILIGGNRVIAGTSAKKENTKIASVKRALFIHEDHAREVRRAIEAHQPSGILILGTSDSMVEVIAKKLELPEIEQKIYIEDVATKPEIEKALATRKIEGKHVIPVPTFAIKKDFSGYFLDPLQIFKRKGRGNYQLMGEKSVVRPNFSYRGKYTISDVTIYQIVEHETMQSEDVHKIARFRVENHSDGIFIDMDIILYYGCAIREVLAEVQANIGKTVEYLTALNIKRLNVTARSLVIRPKD